tara:strand:- start:78 stop:563 length:486 start_codon:yes stop_codon:yes gene_type:complete
MGCGMTYKPSELGVRTNNNIRRPHEKEEEGINFGVALSVLEALLFLCDLDSIPTPPIPPPVTLLGKQRGGLSARRLAGNIMGRLEETGAKLGPRADGSMSVREQMIRITAEETVGEITRNLRVDVGIPPGISITATGANGGGPVQVFGATMAPGFASTASV